MRPLKTSVPFLNSRAVPLRQLGPFAQGLEAAGVDYFSTYDQLTFVTPPPLWTPEVSPMANEVADLDSHHDPFAACAVAAGAAPNLGVLIGGTDGTRRGPAELLQMMLSLADLTEGRAICCLGAGEMKQITPFGYKRSERLRRLEDVLRLVRALAECDGPIDFDGNIWRYRDAYIGCIRRQLPEFWALGGGRKVIELAAKYADGFMNIAPAVSPTPDRFADQVAEIKRQAMAEGRDAEDFGFGCMFQMFCHDDSRVIEAAMENPVIKYYAATCGRVNQADWLAEGIEPVFPVGWHYALDLLPSTVTLAEAHDVIARVTPEMLEKSFFIGTPEQVASQIAQFVEAGVNLIIPADMCLWSGAGADEVAASYNRLFKVIELVKEKTNSRVKIG